MLNGLNQAKNNFEYILNSISDDILILSEDFKIVWANKAILKNTGCNLEDVIGNHCYKLTHDRSSPCVPPHDICPIMQVIQTGSPVAEVHTHVAANGDKRYVEVTAYPLKDESGRIVQFIHISKDITERKSSEEEIKRLYQMMRGILDKSPFGIYVINREGKIDYVNPAMLKISGITYDEFKNLDFEFADKIKSVINDGQYFYMKSVKQAFYPSSKIAIMNISCMPFAEEGEKKALMFVEDITERQKTEEIKNSLTHMIIHDLNNPLAAISVELQLLKLELEGKLTQIEQKDLEIAFTATRNLQAMIMDLLDINKMEEGGIKLKLENIILADLVRQAFEQMKVVALYEDKVLSLEVSENIPAVSVDKRIIGRVVANLINNSLKFIPSKGSIFLNIFYRPEEKMAYIRVKDNGAGIPQEHLNKIFDKFFQVETNKEAQGSGLGLTFCKMMVEAHGGKIWAESEGLNKGATFTVALPV
jgi:PAS domain S-box-containing protein